MDTQVRTATFRERLRSLPEWQRFEESPRLLEVLELARYEFTRELNAGPNGMMGELGILLTDVHLAVAELRCGRDSAEMIRPLIGQAQFDQRRSGIDAALPSYDRAIKLAEKDQSGMGYPVTTICNWVGGKLVDDGRTEEAARYFKRGLKHAKKIDIDTEECAKYLRDILLAKGNESGARRVEAKWLRGDESEVRA